MRAWNEIHKQAFLKGLPGAVERMNDTNLLWHRIVIYTTTPLPGLEPDRINPGDHVDTMCDDFELKVQEIEHRVTTYQGAVE